MKQDFNVSAQPEAAVSETRYLHMKSLSKDISFTHISWGEPYSLNAKISIGKVSLAFFDKVIVFLENVSILFRKHELHEEVICQCSFMIVVFS